MRSLVAFPLLALLAGCVAPGAAPDDAVQAAAAPPGAVASTEEPFAFDGNFGPGAWACPVVTCAGQSMGERWRDLGLDGTLTGANLTLTWKAAHPGMEKLRLGVAWGPDDDREHESAEGASPVVLDLAGLAIAPGDEPYVWVWVVSPVPMGAATAHTPQDFRVEGTLAVAPKA